MLTFDYNRRFGVEIELNSLDDRDFKKYPLSPRELPLGVEYVGNLISKTTNNPVEIEKYGNTHNNNAWIIKPDSSCGIEICSPPGKGWNTLKNICKVIHVFKEDPMIMIDDRCSLHVHVEIADCKNGDHDCKKSTDLAKILMYWVKCEAVFLDSLPINRKKNKYCQCIGLLDLFNHDSFFQPMYIISKMGNQKYYTMNTTHLMRGNRDTVEFRVMGCEGCDNPFIAKNWVRLLVHFVEMAKKMPIPQNYNGDSWSGFSWLNPMEVMELLGFMDNSKLSDGLIQTRNWFIGRLYNNVKNGLIDGIFSDKFREISYDQINELYKKFNVNNDDLHPDSYYNNNV